jgi:hypothetical protein
VDDGSVRRPLAYVSTGVPWKKAGPATVRGDAPVAETVERMRTRGAASLIVSTPEGVLLGLLAPTPPTATTDR